MPKYLDEPGLTRFYDNIADRPVYAFDTVAEMQATMYLEDGMTCHTNGFHASGDGGAAYYTVSASGTANGMDVLALQNSLYAHLVTDGAKVNVRQLGAYGDNSHDDYGVFARAIAKIYEIAPITQGYRDVPIGGGVVYIPKGHYLIGTTFTSTEIVANITFVGEAMGNTYITASAATGFCNLLSSDTYHSWNIKFSNLTFYRCKGITMSCPYGCVFEHLRFADQESSALTGMTLYLTVGTVVRDCIFGGLKVGLQVSGNAGVGPSTSLDVHDCWFNHCESGVELAFASNGIMTSTIHDCIMEYCTYGIAAQGSETYPSSVEIRNIHAEANTYALYASSFSVKFENIIQSSQTDKDYIRLAPQSYNRIIGKHGTATLSNRLNLARHQNNVTFYGNDGTLLDLIGKKAIVKANRYYIDSTSLPIGSTAFVILKYTSSDGSCVATGSLVRGTSSVLDSTRLGTLSARIDNNGWVNVLELPDFVNPMLEVAWSATDAS